MKNQQKGPLSPRLALFGEAISDMADELRSRAETARMFPEGVTSAVAVSNLLDELADRLSTIADDCADELLRTEGAK